MLDAQWRRNLQSDRVRDQRDEDGGKNVYGVVYTQYNYCCNLQYDNTETNDHKP